MTQSHKADSAAIARAYFETERRNRLFPALILLVQPTPDEVASVMLKSIRRMRQFGADGSWLYNCATHAGMVLTHKQYCEAHKLNAET